MITIAGINKITDKIAEIFTNGKVTVDDVESDFTIHSKTVVDNKITINLLFDENYEGNITRVKMTDANGVTIAEQPDNITKLKNKMLLVSFTFEIAEVI